MRFREIWEYIKETPSNTNFSILKGLVDDYVTSQNNPLSDYTISAVIADSVDLLGKKCSDFQKDMVVNDGKVTGTLKYVTGFTGFSGDPAEQQGYYIALEFAHEDADSIKVGGITLDPDGIHIIRIINPVKNPDRKIKVELEDESESVTYVDYVDLSDLDFE